MKWFTLKMFRDEAAVCKDHYCWVRNRIKIVFMRRLNIADLACNHIPFAKTIPDEPIPLPNPDK